MNVIYYRRGGSLIKESELSKLKEIDLSSVIWVDLNFSSEEEVDWVEEIFDINFQTRQQSEEIEISSRYLEIDESVIANFKFFIGEKVYSRLETASFLIKNNTLITYRNADIKTFAEAAKKINANTMVFQTGYDIFLSLLETRIDNDADLIENIAKEISVIGKNLTINKDINEEILIKITELQESTMLVRENIIDKQRVVSAILKSDLFPANSKDKLRIIIKDISSLLEHSAFGFERLEYLQNTFLGLVNIEQNKIIKIFTVVSVIFLPPTLIASAYGMNFQVMPELSWKAGYPFAIILMIFSSLLTLFVFKKRKWL